MAYGLLNPLDDSTEWLFMNGSNPNPAASARRTYAQVLADVNSAGYDTVMIRPSYNNYYQSLQYYSIVMFNLGTRESFHVGNAEYLTMAYENGIAIDSIIGNLAPQNYRTADYRNGSLNVITPSYTLFTALSLSTTKDDINYRGFAGEDNNCIALPCVLLSNANVGTWYFNNSPLVTYTWSSVPSISGKKGTLSLTQILNINDGEPVENVTNRGNLDFSKKTKVNTLVNSAYEPTYKEDATKASVEYEIPEAEYQYTKLVYKKKKIPKSPNDGTAIDIGADDTEAFVSGLEENTTYYFVVFTNRTKSNAYKFKTGKNAPPEGIFKIRITTSQGVKDNDFKEVIEVTRV